MPGDACNSREVGTGAIRENEVNNLLRDSVEVRHREGEFDVGKEGSGG